jgi:hypothetical protein
MRAGGLSTDFWKSKALKDTTFPPKEHYKVSFHYWVRFKYFRFKWHKIICICINLNVPSELPNLYLKTESIFLPDKNLTYVPERLYSQDD